MYCTKCGSEIIGNERFCNQCGTSIDGKGSGLAAESGLPLTVAAKSKKINPMLVVALAIGGVLLVLLFLKGSSGVTFGTSNTPEGVTKAFMEAIVRGDKQAATNLCYEKDEAYYIVGAAILQLCDLSSDYKIRHKPVSYITSQQTDTKARIVVYDEKRSAICTVELSNINGKWYITYCS